MKIEVLGPGCSNCEKLLKNVEKAVKEQNIDGCEIEKVTDLQEIMKFGILATPGLVIDGAVKSSGSIPKDEQLLSWLSGAHT
jgi:small redox-active disulfide protein 2